MIDIGLAEVEKLNIAYSKSLSGITTRRVWPPRNSDSDPTLIVLSSIQSIVLAEYT
jgi:hypothetical protein